jgi:hypothetical protein
MADDTEYERPIMIVAGNYRQATEYARSQNLGRRWGYAFSSKALWGMRNPDVRYVGNYYEHPHWPEVEEILQTLIPPGAAQDD